MSEVVLKDHSIQEPTTAHQHPLETIPQGSQSDGVLNGHEHRDANVPVMYRAAAGLLAVVALSLVLSWAVMNSMLNSLSREDALPSATYAERANLESTWPNPAIEAELQPPAEAPDLQPDPEKPLLVLREQEYQRLNGTDKNGQPIPGVLPIEDAMALTLQRGLPTQQRANVRVLPPTGHIAEMGSIPAGEVKMKEAIQAAQKNGANQSGGNQSNVNHSNGSQSAAH